MGARLPLQLVNSGKGVQRAEPSEKEFKNIGPLKCYITSYDVLNVPRPDRNRRLRRKLFQKEL